jgi:hypothetical protein
MKKILNSLNNEGNLKRNFFIRCFRMGFGKIWTFEICCSCCDLENVLKSPLRQIEVCGICFYGVVCRQRNNFMFIWFHRLLNLLINLYKYVNSCTLTACNCRLYLQSIFSGFYTLDLWILDDLHQALIHKTKFDLQICQGLLYDEETMEQYLKEQYMLAFVLVWFFKHFLIGVVGLGGKEFFTIVISLCLTVLVELSINEGCYGSGVI